MFGNRIQPWKYETKNHDDFIFSTTSALTAGFCYLSDPRLFLFPVYTIYKMAEIKHVRPSKRNASTAAPSSSGGGDSAETPVAKSILKKSSKYSSSEPSKEDLSAEGTLQTPASTNPKIVQEFVVERPRQPPKKKKIPKKQENPEEPILSFNSISDLMEAAGSELPSQVIQEGAVVEAGLEFSCCDPVEYLEETRDDQYRVFLGLRDDEVGDKENSGGLDILDDDDESAAEARQFARELLEQEKNDPNYNPDDYYSDSDDEEEPEAPKPFLILWNALAQWVSPEAVKYVKQIRDGSPDAPVPERTTVVSDIEASRCSGLWSALQMHVQPCWNSLDEKREEYQTIQQRLIRLLQLLDYQLPTPSLSTAMIKALTCVLLDTIALSNSTLPEPCERAGLKEEEYRYLVRQAFLSFGVEDES